jgi:P-type Mg2+ transporter
VASVVDRVFSAEPAGPTPGLARAQDHAWPARLHRLAQSAPLQVLREFDSSLRGLDEREAQARLDRSGENIPPAQAWPGLAATFVRTLLDPFVMVLLLLGTVSALTHDGPAVAVIAVLAAISCGLRVGQEYHARRAAAALGVSAATTTTVVRRASVGAAPLAREVPTDQLVPGDIVRLAAGDAVSADLRLLRASGLVISQALLTGESMPVTRYAQLSPADDHDDDTGAGTLFDDPRLCLQGATVVSGTATAVVVATGAETYFAANHHHQPYARGRTTFDREVRAVSWILIALMAAAVPVVLWLTRFHRDSWVQACLFAMAIAVGLIPEMLPVVVTTALLRAHTVLRQRGIVVKHLPAIHNLGAMDVLCLDKTGTLTLGRLTVTSQLDPIGRPDPAPLQYAYLNARLGLDGDDPPAADAIDDALLRAVDHADGGFEAEYTCLHTLAFDPTRRRSTVAVRAGREWARHLLITKGAVESVLDCCTHARIRGRDKALTRAHRRRLQLLADQLHTEGVRVIAVAVGNRPAGTRPLRPSDESGLTLIGYVGLLDEVRPAARSALAELTSRGVQVKVLTGDHPLAAARICRDAGVDPGQPVSGYQINDIDDGQLASLARVTTVFARVDAGQKARIVTALRAAGHTVGYMGDGVNDAAALYAADVSACMEDAVDAARQASDVLLAGKDLAVLTDAVSAGRHAHGNVIKYLKITVSSTLGNVCAVLAASATLPFLPMLPLQLLVQNLLFDVSQLSLAYDRTDPEGQARPRTLRPLDMTRFVLCFGAINALADLATFAALKHTLPSEASPAGQALFHTGWFVENLLAQVLAVHMLRSRRGAAGWTWAARPVVFTSVVVVVATLALPWTPIGAMLGQHPLPVPFFLWLVPILGTYAVAMLAGKRVYQRALGVWS